MVEPLLEAAPQAFPDGDAQLESLPHDATVSPLVVLFRGTLKVADTVVVSRTPVAPGAGDSDCTVATVVAVAVGVLVEVAVAVLVAVNVAVAVEVAVLVGVFVGV
jgi:hypothetical protein